MGEHAEVLALLCILLFVAVAWIGFSLWKLKRRFKPITDVESEIDALRQSIQRETHDFEQRKNEKRELLASIEIRLAEKTATTARLNAEIALLEENLNDLSYGLYKPHYDFEDPEDYKKNLEKIYESKKRLIHDNAAVTCPDDWTVNGSKSEGRKLVKKESKLLLRAFNNELEAAISKIVWNNADRMIERVKKSYEVLNDLGAEMRTEITRDYLKLALAELRLTYEWEQKKQSIKEEQRKIKEQMREEELAQREFERAKKAAADDEARYQKALAAARAEMETAKATEIEMEAIALKVSTLEHHLAEAQAKLQHAVSMAQLTRSGHVYVISNIGSFGEDVFKIGMTRRLDPTERVDELSSASVPFPFDIHAMIYAGDAPALENAFHMQFNHRRVNKINTRKEFFQISLDEIERFALQHHAEIQFTKLAEARKYRLTVAEREFANQNELATVV